MGMTSPTNSSVNNKLRRPPKAVLFDLGDTLIKERVDDVRRLDEMTLYLKPHAKDVLEGLSRICKIGLLSDTETSPESAVRAALRKLGVESFFSAVVTSMDVGAAKPHRDPFLEALRQLDVSPTEAVMVGNDPGRDILGAKRLGMITILYRSSSYYHCGAEKEADYFVDSLDAIPPLVHSLQKSRAAR